MGKTSKKVHLVNLFKWRSVVAFAACALTICLTLGSVVYGIINSPGELVKTEFEWFTIDSNCFTAFAALMILPYAVEGMRKKRLFYPKWMLLCHFAGAICISITFVFVLCFISWYDPQLAFGRENIFLHIICPIAVMISFFMVESDYLIDRKDIPVCLIPFAAYSVLYVYNVAITGNWEDHYMLNTFVPAYVSLPLMYILVFAIASVLRRMHNKLVAYRDRKLKLIWDEELDPVTVRIEIYSLGIHAGMKQDKQDISIPYDILEQISEKFAIRIEDLINAYSKGVIEGIKEAQ